MNNPRRGAEARQKFKLASVNSKDMMMDFFGEKAMSLGRNLSLNEYLNGAYLNFCLVSFGELFGF